MLIRDHHEGTIAWAEFERNQRTLAANAYGRSGGGKSGRGGRALLAGMARLRPLRAGPRRGLHRPVFPGRPVCRCDRPNLERGLPRCLTFGGARADAAIAAEVLRVVEPMAIEAAREAERMRAQSDAERRQMAGLDLRQARLTRRRWPSAATPPATPTFA